MSIIDELLVLLDEGKTMTLEEIKKKLPDRTLQTVSSTLGRLEAKGWLQGKKEKDDIHYRIVAAGQDEVTSTLAEIKKTHLSTSLPQHGSGQVETGKPKWSGSWQIVVFNIPEKIRSARDLFRIYLERLGYGRLQNSLWLSCWDNSQELNKIIENLNITKYVSILNSGKFSANDQKIILDRFEWDWTKLNKQYKDFLGQATRFFLSRKDSFGAKKLVYQYAKILKNDPKFPEEIQPRRYLGNKAFEAYQRVRPYCYK